MFLSFINSEYFNFEYGDPSSGSRIIDSQWVTSNKYVSTVMNNQECFFGVNFADGRIKGYGYESKPFYFFFVRGNENYGKNNCQWLTYNKF